MVLSIVSPWGKDHEDTRLNRTYEALWSILRTFLKSAPVKTVLDFGCGDGSYSFLIRKWAFKLPKLMLCSPPHLHKKITPSTVVLNKCAVEMGGKGGEDAADNGITMNADRNWNRESNTREGPVVGIKSLCRFSL